MHAYIPHDPVLSYNFLYFHYPQVDRALISFGCVKKIPGIIHCEQNYHLPRKKFVRYNES